jgi:hypothetical protein
VARSRDQDTDCSELNKEEVSGSLSDAGGRLEKVKWRDLTEVKEKIRLKALEWLSERA